MHEAMVAENILTAILAEAEKQNKKPVRAVMSCGQINAVNDQAMEFAFQAAAKDTVCEDVELVVRHKSMQASCRNCDSEFDFDLKNPICPHCGKADFSIGQDPPLMLDEIEFE